jgi:hypothetical protein
MRRRNLALLALVGGLIGLGLFVNSIFVFAGMATVSGLGHLFAHNQGNGNQAKDDDQESKSSCH